MSTACRLISPWSKKGLLKASVLDLAITVLSRSKNAAVRTGLPGSRHRIRAESSRRGRRVGCGHGAQHRRRSDCRPTEHATEVAVHDTCRRPATFQVTGVLSVQAGLAPPRVCVCIVSITRLMPGVHQPDPPGLIHDDLRLLPPGGGRPFFWGHFRWPASWRLPLGCGTLFVDACVRSTFIHSRDFIHRFVRWRWRRVGSCQHSGRHEARATAILALVADAALRDDVDRVAAAAGRARRPRRRSRPVARCGRRRRRSSSTCRGRAAVPNSACRDAIASCCVGARRAGRRRLADGDRRRRCNA